MRTTFLILLAGPLIAGLQAGTRGDEPSRFVLNNGDRIVLVGDTLVERDQRYGYLETLLTLSNPDKDLTFRNLGWSGDTVAGLSRAGFDPPQAGYRQLIEQVLAAQADRADRRLRDGRILRRRGRAAEVRLGPEPVPRRGGLHQGAGRPALADRACQPGVALARPVAAQRDARQVLTRDRRGCPTPRGPVHRPLRADATARGSGDPPITDDGVVPNEAGYRFLAGLIARGLAPSETREVPRLELTQDAAVGPVRQARVERVEPTPSGVRFRLRREALAVAGDEAGGHWIDPAMVLAAAKLPEGRYELRVDGRRLPGDPRPAAEWARGVRLAGGPDLEQVDRLRETINRKNRLFFHRWRPQNITYLFGFRKHEQGNNAVEIPRFDPLVAEQERGSPGSASPSRTITSWSAWRRSRAGELNPRPA